ncbi:helix-turn-helix domain-containing protein [Aquibaculum arenosum]|uniref:Helix-turn-helix domain-containing protein n=1 Tax=Aquibaculum arenosum TaxID=3032591 RepID=A0ABT5YLE1_9PROT|nr:helix-turn-helix domain-containing protein [Fodinicurvata sp. CAU 1616]MDF2095079.1 helix-turn-helix domain-containing protein [Fodinicurvata sp. CAU 1616]
MPLRESDIESLQQIPLFSGLGIPDLKALTAGALLQRFPARTRLFDSGAQPDFLHILLDGSVQLSATEADSEREVVIEIVTPPDCFILAAALTDTPYLMSATVQEPARLLLLPAAELRRNIAAHPELALTLLASLAGQFRRMVRQVKNLKLRTTVQRVGCFLLSLAEPGDESEMTVQLPYDKQVIASQLGMTRESLSRALATLRDLGVETQNDRILLKDPVALAAYCHPDRLIDGVEKELSVPR